MIMGVIKEEQIRAQLEAAGMSWEEYEEAGFIAKTNFLGAIARSNESEALSRIAEKLELIGQT